MEKSIPLHDIKPLVDITDYTLPFLVTAAVLAALLTLALGYLLWKRWRGAQRENRRRRCLEALRKVDLDDTKNAAYAITRLGLCFAKDSVRLQEAYGNLTARLSPYKYRRSVPKMDGETRAYFRIFLGMIDV